LIESETQKPAAMTAADVEMILRASGQDEAAEVVKELIQQARRYEATKALNQQEFGYMQRFASSGTGRFDDMVDELLRCRATVLVDGASRIQAANTYHRGKRRIAEALGGGK
jgi:hypothetical protein